MQNITRRRRRSGTALVEVTLMAPWIFFLFVGVLDFGFYAYSFLSVENAARAAALYTSQSKTAASDQASACTVVLAELKWNAYGRAMTTCGTAPLVVTASLVNGPDGTDATKIEVQYTTLSMIPIPGVLASSFVIDRVWKMKVNPTTDF